MEQQPRAVAPQSARNNPIRTRANWEADRAACAADPGRFHAAIARRTAHWLERSIGAWITFDASLGAWTGFDAETGAPVTPALPADYAPWTTAFSDAEAPFYRWFDGALTNACFNEVDRHVLAGHGDEAAFIFEGDRWDQSLDAGRGGPVVKDRRLRPHHGSERSGPILRE